MTRRISSDRWRQSVAETFRSCRAVLVGAVVMVVLASCSSWTGPNSLPLPGTPGRQDDAIVVTIQMANVNGVEQNSEVLVDDVSVGTVTGIARQGWHALVTVSLLPSVDLPANATATVGQTSLLGTLHIALSAPAGEEPAGRLTSGAVIPLARSGGYPTTEQTLASVSTVLNGGGLAQLQDINRQVNSALGGHEEQARSLIRQLAIFTRNLNEQKSAIIAATRSTNELAEQISARSGTVDRALETIPGALDVLARDRENLRNAITAIGEFAGLADQVVRASSSSVTDNLRALQPTLRELAAAGPNLTRSLGLLSTFPWPQDGIRKFIRGDAGNLSATIDLTIGRADNSYLQMTGADGRLTAFETLLGRTIGRQPMPSTKNPLSAPILRGGS